MAKSTQEMLLVISDLHVQVDGREILKGVNMRIPMGQTHILMGPNGCGKSTLVNTIMGLGNYKVTKGHIYFKGTDIVPLTVDERARLGIGLMFQKPPTLAGLKLRNLLHTILQKCPRRTVHPLDDAWMEKCIKAAHLEGLVGRDINMGFSGGELKRSELLQMLVQQPEFAMFDEPESGVDVENIELVGKLMNRILQGKERKQSDAKIPVALSPAPDASSPAPSPAAASVSPSSFATPSGGLVITHTGHILRYISASTTHVMIGGQIRCFGDPQSIFKMVSENGFDKCADCICAGGQCQGCPKSGKCRCPLQGVHITRGNNLDGFVACESAAPKPEKQQSLVVAAPKRAVKLDADDLVDDLKEHKAVVSDDTDYSKVDYLDDAPDPLKPASACSGASCMQYVQDDNRILHEKHGGSNKLAPGIRCVPIADLLATGELKDYLWKAVNPEKDAVTKEVLENKDQHGYVVIAEPGSDSGPVPVRTALHMNCIDKQRIHNIVIAKAGSRLHVLTSCTCHSRVGNMQHLGVTEFFVEKGAFLTNTMIHKWCDKSNVRPRSAAIVQEDGVFISNYVNLRAVASIQMNPLTTLAGPRARAYMNTIVIAHPNSTLDTGSSVHLSAENARAEIVSRVVSFGGKVLARALISGNYPNTYGHIECNGLIMGAGVKGTGKVGSIHAIPEIGADCDEMELSHEAAVGKIARDKIEYAMARGLTEDEAVGAVVRGFLDVEMKGIPEGLQKEIREAVTQAAMASG